MKKINIISDFVSVELALIAVQTTVTFAEMAPSTLCQITKKSVAKQEKSNKLKLKIYFLLFLNVLLFSCNQSNAIQNQQTNLECGVVITFDDDYVDEWFEVNTVLKPYDWKATFFVAKFNQLSANKIKKLKDLKDYGHEIGGHGLNHLNAPKFISGNGEIEYLNKEIYPMITLMNNNDLFISSFAYPYGERNLTTDKLLLNEFKIVRGTIYGNTSPAYQNCFYNNSNIVLGLGIDKNYSHFSITYFLSLLEYAKNNNKIVIFYAHKPVKTFESNYETEYQTLIEICNYVKSNNMKFYKISELNNLKLHQKYQPKKENNRQYLLYILNQETYSISSIPKSNNCAVASLVANGTL